jgi:hypothetical protein
MDDPVQRHEMSLAASRTSTVPVVTITSFAARARVDRTFTVPGIFGGAQCTP